MLEHVFDNRECGADAPAHGCAASSEPSGTGAGIDAGRVHAWTAALAAPLRDLDDAGRIDLIRALEDLKSAASAAQARASVDLDVSQRAAQRGSGVHGELLGRGVGAQVALARRESPYAGGRYLGLAKALVGEMPHTLAALSAGVLSEWRATLLVRESGCLSREDRSAFDEAVARDAAALVGLGTRALVARARAVALRLDAASVVARARRAESERCVTLRPAPDTMTYLTALLPVAQGVAVYAALVRAADSARAVGDPRGRGQVMADELVARVAAGTGVGGGGSGNAPASVPTAHRPAEAPGMRLEVQVVMTDRTLLGGADEPATIPGYGTVPGAWARDLVLDALEPASGRHRSAGTPGPVRVWLRRLFTAPSTGQLVAMDSRARLAPDGLADLIRARDGTCRTPWCDAPVRQIDHVVPNADAGPTTADNLQGLCEACNHTKQAPGWRQAPHRTPARRTSSPPPLPDTATSHAPRRCQPALASRTAWKSRPTWLPTRTRRAGAVRRRRRSPGRR